jgi:polyadenylate-binding protein
VKNFNPDWSEENLKAIFSKYGDIKSLIVLKKKDKEGIEKPFAFVCFERPGEPAYGPECANRAVEDLHDKELDGFKIYVQPALPADQRQAQVYKEQQRFKNSKKKCNLFVKGFPATYSSDDLKNLFSQFGDIESVKILPTTEGQVASRAFVCFKTPDSAAQARARLHQQTIDSKQLFVTNYELPEIRKKQQADAKDKADFMNLRKQNSAPLDPSLLQRPDTIQLIQQILFLI